MLGLGKPKNIWNWAACGKHPVVRDYFRISSSTSLFVAFENWIEKGYQIVSKQGISARHVYSWRFWAKGVKKGNLICGVAKDSSDSIGRPYPLLIMGDGVLEEWEEHWDLLPFVLERSWLQMEYLSIKRFIDLKQLEHEIRMLRSPEPMWLEYSQDRQRRYATATEKPEESGWDSEKIQKEILSLSHQPDLIISVNPGQQVDIIPLIGSWHTLIKDFLKKAPNAVFTGGTQNKMNLAIFRKALIPEDFRRLWINTDGQ